jgi:hypothetical protein
MVTRLVTTEYFDTSDLVCIWIGTMGAAWFRNGTRRDSAYSVVVNRSPSVEVVFLPVRHRPSL